MIYSITYRKFKFPYFLGKKYFKDNQICVRRFCLNQKKDDLTYFEREKLIKKDTKKYYPNLDEGRKKLIEHRDKHEIIRIDKFISKFREEDFSKNNQRSYEDKIYILEGRIKRIRKSGKGIFFFDIVQDNVKIQLMSCNKFMNLSIDDFNNLHKFLKINDFVISYGNAYLSNSGELTLKLKKPLLLVSPCLNELPNDIVGSNMINSNRIMNYLLHEKSKNPIIIKSLLVDCIRSFLKKRNFIEVSTPMLACHGSGAIAKPFETFFKSSLLQNEKTENFKLQLRVSPELWLKKLIAGGFDKIFEIGTSFRNEGIDSTHNPEFSSCEFYQSFINLNDLINITQDLFSFIHSYFLSKNLSYMQPVLKNFTSFTQKIKKYEFIPTLESITGVELPKKLTAEHLINYHKITNTPFPELNSINALINNLSYYYLERISREQENVPIIIYNYPSFISPLAKSSDIIYILKKDSTRVYNISHNFELFINGIEIINSYEEENSPFEQENKFSLQRFNDNKKLNEEVLTHDFNYLKIMGYSLPPLGGWGCGIERLTMLLSGSEKIQSVLLFGTLKDVVKQ